MPGIDILFIHFRNSLFSTGKDDGNRANSIKYEEPNNAKHRLPIELNQLLAPSILPQNTLIETEALQTNHA